ncbi:cell wall-active antibiotics response protein LiaF [Virgibacillus sp. MG-45]|uniref:cell wall-active antibiotics response protein LiaF n=1 Tax=Virgibacillus sp. MG-45 TaxID=3102791 RepID=UPI002EDA678B
MRKGFFRYLIALILIIAGIMLVLENIGITTFNMKQIWLYLYPILFILFGIKWMFESIVYKGGSMIGGSFLFIFGTLLFLDRFGVIEFIFKDVFKLWPLLIVYFGFLFIKGKNNPHFYIGTNKSENEDKYEKYTSFSFGDYEFNKPNWKAEPMALKSMAGDFYLDFSKAFIPEKKIPINIRALAGDIHILIPENVEFRVVADVKAGDIDVVGNQVDGINRSLVFETTHYEGATQKLEFTLKLKAGSIRVDYV